MSKAGGARFGAGEFGAMNALALTAGGARGAYQAGVLKRIAELPRLRGGGSPFPIVTGASAGAINGATVAASSDGFSFGANELARLWASVTMAEVVRADVLALAANVGKLGLDMGLGGLIGAGRSSALLDASPLRRYLSSRLPLHRLGQLIAKGKLYAVGITATAYHSGFAYTFIQGRDDHPLWMRSRRVALRSYLTIDHICASAAIPIVFPPHPLMINGALRYFGDGAMRMVNPLSPAIRLGADRLLAIGVRSSQAAERLLESELMGLDGAKHPGGRQDMRRPPLSQICGVFLNAIFLDHLDADLEHLERLNGLVEAMPDLPTPAGRQQPLRQVRALAISPSADLAEIARFHEHRLPRPIRYVLDGLGTPDAHSADLCSYLLFDPAYTRELIDIGYRDAAGRADEIEEFLLG